MIYKSYLIENNLKNLDKKIYLFFGENHGLKEVLNKLKSILIIKRFII